MTWWQQLTDAERAAWTCVAGCVALFGIHQVLYANWLIEDAAISYSFAQHAASGEGWVAWPGGEWVEGFSNPTWTALLTSSAWVGLDPWTMGKLYGLLFGALTLPLAFLWAKEITQDEGLLPVTAPLLLAVSPQFSLWCASGLENPLFGWLLALGSLALLQEIRDGDGFASALPLGLLGITRPEAPLYVAAAALVTVVAMARRHGPRSLWRVVVWTALCATPWCAYELYRLDVFAWPLPNTYYAKLDLNVDKFQPWSWTGQGWGYLRGWALWSGWGFVLPALPVLATGVRGRRGAIGLATSFALLLLLLPGAQWLQAVLHQVFDAAIPAEPERLALARVRVLLLCAVVLPWLGLGRPGDTPRILAWVLAVTSLFFALYAGADWMKGHRWLSMCAVPLSVLLADLVVQASRLRAWADPPHARRMSFALIGGGLVAAGVSQTVNIVRDTDTAPFDVYRRVVYMQGVQDRLHLDHAVNLEVDFGAQMWWSGDALVDVAGLMDVSMAHHAWERPFIKEYVFEEQRPDLMHSHGPWKTRSGMGFQPAFTRGYVEVTPYVAGRRYLHVGNHVRRDLFVEPEWQGGVERTADFAGLVTLQGLDVPAPQVLSGGTLYVELGLQHHGPRQAPVFRTLLLLSGQGELLVWDLPPGYDWLRPQQWRRTDVVIGRHTLTLPADLPHGTYDLGVVLMGPDGVMAAAVPHDQPVFATGEIRWQDVVEVRAEPEVLTRVRSQTEAIHQAVQSARCLDAEQALHTARRHLPSNHPDQPWSRTTLHAQIAGCWARRAVGLEPERAEAAIARARRWDHHEPEVVRVGQQLADQWEAEGDRSHQAGRDEAAYLSWRRALAADPTRAWVRRRAEEARDRRLGLTDP